MTSSDASNVLPETAAERLRQHLQEIANERDRAHRALQEREAELARIQRIGRVGGVEVDFRDGFKNRRSPEYLIIHGLPPDAANETHEDWVEPDPSRATASARSSSFFDALAGRDEDYIATYRIVRPNDGQTRWIDVVAKIERDGDGRALRLVGAHIDVTDRMLAQEKLRESEERFRLIADSAPVPMWVTKLDRTRSFANQAYLDFLGLPFEEAIAFDWRKRLHPDDQQRRRAGIDRRRGLAQAVRAGSALPRRRRRMALAALGIPAALGPDRQATSASSASPTTSPPPSRPSTICAG